MKYKFIIAIAIVLMLCPAPARSMDLSVSYYAPSFIRFVSGEPGVIGGFFDETLESRNSCFLLPLEIKLSVLHSNTPFWIFNTLSLSGNTIISSFFEDGSFSSLNISAGASFYLDTLVSPSMSGMFLSLYPVYELPVFSFGKTWLSSWQAAADIGGNLVLPPFQLGWFTRLMFVWDRSNFYVWPDMGVTVGFYLPF